MLLPPLPSANSYLQPGLCVPPSRVTPGRSTLLLTLYITAPRGPTRILAALPAPQTRFSVISSPRDVGCVVGSAPRPPGSLRKRPHSSATSQLGPEFSMPVLGGPGCKRRVVRPDSTPQGVGDVRRPGLSLPLPRGGPHGVVWRGPAGDVGRGPAGAMGRGAWPDLERGAWPSRGRGPAGGVGRGAWPGLGHGAWGVAQPGTWSVAQSGAWAGAPPGTWASTAGQVAAARAGPPRPRLHTR